MMTGLYHATKISVWGAALLGMAFLIAGCEADSARSPIVIDPDNIQIRWGQQQMFVAQGGYEYEWSIDNPELGMLTRTRDSDRVLYTAIAAPDEGLNIQILRVTSWIDGAHQSGGTNVQTTVSTTSHRVSAEARIMHMPDPEAPTPEDVPTLVITPAIASMGVTELSRTFTVSGGRAPYTWSISNTALGNLATVGSNAIYTRGTNPGSQFVIVVDAAGRQVEAAITQTGVIPAPNGNGNDG